MINKILFWSLFNIFILIQTIVADENSNSTQTTDAKPNDPINNILLQSISLIGIPYKWGGNTPQQGMDCSGFIRYVFKKSLGINLPRTSSEIAKTGVRVSFSHIKPGDLIFFNTHRGHNTHIGMYIGNNKFIQSPHTGEEIQISDLTPKTAAKISLIKRIVDATPDDSNIDTSNEDDDDDIDKQQITTPKKLNIINIHHKKHHYRKIHTKLHKRRVHKKRATRKHYE